MVIHHARGWVVPLVVHGPIIINHLLISDIIISVHSVVGEWNISVWSNVPLHICCLVTINCQHCTHHARVQHGGAWCWPCL